MEDRHFNFHKVKKKYLKFLTSQEVMSEPFRDKLGQLNKFYLPISKMIAKEYLKTKKTKVIGLTGGQGTGKSTISNILKIILKEAYKLETVIFSIDDFYKTLSERKKISKKISPLFLTRGAPGTHDTKMLLNCINNLKNNNFKKMIIPKSIFSVKNIFRLRVACICIFELILPFEMLLNSGVSGSYNNKPIINMCKLCLSY